MKTAAPESPRVEYDAEGIAWVVFDDPGSKVNVLGLEQMQRLDAAVDDLSKRKPKAVIFISAKPNIFIAGADIKELAVAATDVEKAAASARLADPPHDVLQRAAPLRVLPQTLPADLVDVLVRQDPLAAVLRDMTALRATEEPWRAAVVDAEVFARVPTNDALHVGSLRPRAACESR